MNTSKMISNFKSNHKLLLRLMKRSKFERTFLSESYQCQEAWNKRLESSLLKKVKPVDFFLELDQKYQSQGKISAVDVDIFANSIKDGSHIEELADVLHKLRKTRETTFTLDSTHHAVARYYLEVGEAKQLLDILNDRLNYGIFCDHFCYNLLMDHFIKNEDFASAAKVATFLMLQEDFEHPVCNALAIYSCHRYLENPDSWQEVDPETLKEEPKEEVKIRVNYLRNPYFDDHFDLWKPSDLVGKTLFLIGQTMNDPIGRSSHLRGLIVYKKYGDAISLIENWKEAGIQQVVYKDILQLIKTDASEIFNETDNEEIKKLQKSLSYLETVDLVEGNLIEALENLVKKSIESCAQEDIEKQTKIYSEWEEKRIKVLKEHLAELDRQQRLAKVEEIKQDLEERERLLTFFEKEEEIELNIEKKLERERELYGEENQVVQDLEENYVPPEIVKKKQTQ